jgi:hypothetical protein
MAIQKIANVNNIETTQEQRWMLYNDETKIVIEGPFQCSGYTSSPNVMVIADTEEELLTYIEENKLIVPIEEEEYSYDFV